MNLVRKFENLYYNCKNLFKWFRIIFNDRDFDYDFTLEILKFKLQNQRDYFYRAEIIENSRHYGDRINTIVKLIDLGYKNTYVDKFTDELRKIYGDDIYHLWICRRYSNLTGDKSDTALQIENKALIDDLDFVYNKHIVKMEQKTERVKDLVWKMLSNNIENFWD